MAPCHPRASTERAKRQLPRAKLGDDSRAGQRLALEETGSSANDDPFNICETEVPPPQRKSVVWERVS